MKMTMYDYIKNEQEVCMNILENRKENLNDFIQVMKKQPSLKKLIFLATGSSANAVNCGKHYIEKMMGLEVEIKIPYSFAIYEKMIKNDTLAIAVSQSGSSYSTIEAIRKAGELCIQDTFAMTARIDSPLARCSDHIINIGCGEEKVGFVTMGFTSTVLTLMLLAIEGAFALKKISKDDYDKEIDELKSAIGKIDQVIKNTEGWYDKNKGELIRGERFITIAYGPNYGAALEGFTKITETIKCPVNAYELEEYLHGPNLELNPKHFIFFIQSKGQAEERLLVLKKFISTITEHCFTISYETENEDAKVLALGYDGEENLSPLLFSIPFQLLAYRLSADKGISLEVDLFKDFSKALNIKVAQ